MRGYFGAIKSVYPFARRCPSTQKSTCYQVEVVGVGCCWSCGDHNVVGVHRQLCGAPLFLKLCLCFPSISNCSNDVDKM